MGVMLKNLRCMMIGGLTRKIDRISNDLSDEEEYKDMTDDEYDKMIDKKVNETEFVNAIVVYVG